MILNGAINGKYEGMIRIDLHKAFENLDHKILLDEMKYIGFSDKKMNSFCSYFINRLFFISLGTVFWEAGAINYGVSQGCILFIVFGIHK